MFELVLTILMGVAQSLSRLGSDALMHWPMKNPVRRHARQHAFTAILETALARLAERQGNAPAPRGVTIIPRRP